MKFNSEFNLHFRFILCISYLVFIWYPTRFYLFIFPLALSFLDENSKHKKFKRLTILLITGFYVYFFVDNLDMEQQIALSIIVFGLNFSDVLKKYRLRFKDTPK